MTTNAPAGASAPRVNCRTIEFADLEAVAQCLDRGFPIRKIEDWRTGLARMTNRAGVPGFPKYGYCLDVAGEIVGVLLQVYSQRVVDGESRVQCNLSSWCVDPEYRMFATALSMSATKRKDVTYFNVSPAQHTRKSIEALGFRRYVRGQMIFAPLLSRRVAGTRIAAWRGDLPEAALLSAAEREILAEHHAMGCRAFVGLCDGEAFGFVSSPTRVLKGRLGCEEIVYFRDAPTLAKFAGAIGAYFFTRVNFLCIVDGNEAIQGLVGRYVPSRSLRYYRGPAAPRVGDLAYTELVMLRECAGDPKSEDRVSLDRVLDFAAARRPRRKPASGVAPAKHVGGEGNVTRVEFTGARAGQPLPAIGRRLERVRAFAAADIAGVAEMFRDVFREPRDRSALKLPALSRDLEEIFLEHPYAHDSAAPLVLERDDGKIGGFLGVIPIPFLLDGVSRRGGALSTWMVRDPKLDLGGGAKLARAHLRGAQELTLIDTANSQSLTFARAMDTVVLTSHSLQWTTPLNYTGYLLLRLAGPKRARGAAALASWVKRPEDGARRLTARGAEPAHSSFAIDAETFAGHFLRFSRESRVRPDWSADAIVWMLGIAGRRTALGKLHLREVRDSAGAVVGCHAFHATPGGRAVALQVLAEPRHLGTALDDFIASARAENCVIAGGPTSPRLMRALFARSNIFYRHTCAVGARSKLPEALDAILAGDGLIGGLVGDAWTPLSTETYR